MDAVVGQIKQKARFRATPTPAFFHPPEVEVDTA